MKKEIKYLMIVALIVSVLALIGVLLLFGEKIVSDEKIHQQTKENPSISLIANLVAIHSFSHGAPDAKVTVI